jgi:hypothetical protein
MSGNLRSGQKTGTTRHTLADNRDRLIAVPASLTPLRPAGQLNSLQMRFVTASQRAGVIQSDALERHGPHFHEGPKR